MLILKLLLSSGVLRLIGQRVATDQARPGVEINGEAGRQSDIGGFADPKLARRGRNDAFRKVRKGYDRCRWLH